MMRKVNHFSILIIMLALCCPDYCFAQGAKGQHMRMHTIPVSKKKSRIIDESSVTRVGFIAPLSKEKANNDSRIAFEALSKMEGVTSEFVAFDVLNKAPKKIRSFDLLWVHGGDSASEYMVSAGLKDALTSFVENGGKLLLTQDAVHYLNTAGFEPTPVYDSLKSSVDDGYGRNLGFHAFRDHPVFEGLNGGAYVLKPESDCAVMLTGFFGSSIPLKGKVVAVDWDYIFLREHSKILTEYHPGKGMILAVGGYMEFGMPNRNLLHLEKFLKNCIAYLGGEKNELPLHYWNYVPRDVSTCPVPPESDRLVRAPAPSFGWQTEPHSLALKRNFATENFWDVAGERMVTMGIETGGIEEVWAHPFMAMRDYRVGIRFSYKDSIYWLNDERPEITVEPGSFGREYRFRRAYLREIIVNDPYHPAGVVHYEYRGVYPAELIISFSSNLRLMWPYSEEVTGSLCHRFDPDLSAIVISNGNSDMHLMIGANRNPTHHLEGRFDGFTFNRNDSLFEGNTTATLQAAGLLVYPLNMNDNLDIVFAASAGEPGHTYEAFYEALHNPFAIMQASAEKARNVLSSNVMITSPDEQFNKGYRWAILAADRFTVNTPGMGTALVAGYASTRKGWNGGHIVNGRPGYAWYFGRDAEWSCFASLAQGNFSMVKSQLSFFEKYQDLTGKIFHEASTSGIIHYDAADATPLYVLLAGRYFRHTADTQYLKSAWSSISRAIDFCYSTDTDGDKLIENTNVGHGWVEGGGLYGSHSTIYMAGIWGAALKEASVMAEVLGKTEANTYRWNSEEQFKRINSSFWSDDSRFFAYGMNRDQTYRRDQTILPAVPILLKMTEQEKAALCARLYAGNAFTTNWGVRILRDDNPMFKPTGYHYGTVWPLFTGWASLAGYASGNPVQGFSHLMNNLGIYRYWGLGFVEEVMSGAEFKPSGVCPHQCWSETMVIQPAIEGMLGLTIDAPSGKINLAPALPFHWDSLYVTNIRMANQIIHFRYDRNLSEYRYRFDKTSSGKVSINFMPLLPPGTHIKSVKINEKEVPFTTFRSSNGMALMVPFDIGEEVILVAEYEGGVGILPSTSNPVEGESPEGLRILSSLLKGNTYNIELEGPPGKSYGFAIWTAPGVRLKTSGIIETAKTGQVTHYTVDLEQSISKYSIKTVTFDIDNAK